MAKRTAGGRPPTYQPDFARQAAKLCEMGATDSELADFFKVCTRTISRWQGEHPEFCQSLKIGKAATDERVVRSLYHRAVGYEHDAVKIFNDGGTPMLVPFREHIAPDVTACIFWLKNRRREEWRDRHDHQVDVSIEDGRTPDEKRMALIDKLVAMLGSGVAPLIEGDVAETTEDNGDA